MKEVYRTQSLAKADVISSMLAANGIRSFMPDKNIASSYPPLMVFTGIRLLVDDDDYALAARLIEEQETNP